MYKILTRFRGYDEERIFEVGETFEFSDERAEIIIDKLGTDFIEKIEEPIDFENAKEILTEKNSVAEIKSYLSEHQIEFDDKSKKADLLQLIK